VSRRLAYAGIFAVLAVLIWYAAAARDEGVQDVATAAPSIPDLTPKEQAGQRLFADNCAVCHGENAAGTDQGPPLVHPIYEPGHHGDMAFVRAAMQGVPAHHWRFGDMPAVEGVSEEEVLQITSYVRAIQRANGIE